MPKSSFAFCSLEISFSSQGIGFRDMSFVVYKFERPPRHGTYILTSVMFTETLLNILGKADIEVAVLITQQNIYVIHSPQEIIALYHSQKINMAAPCTRVFAVP